MLKEMIQIQTPGGETHSVHKPNLMQTDDLLNMVEVIRSSLPNDFNVVVVFDNMPAMEIWRVATRKFVSHLSAVLPVFFWEITTIEDKEMDTEFTSGSTVFLHDYGQPNTPPQYYDTLTNKETKTLVFVITDCSSASWDNGSMYNLLKSVSQTSSLAILQVLPESLWDSTAITYAQSYLVSTTIQEVTQVGQLFAFKIGWGHDIENRTGDLGSPVFPTVPFDHNGITRLFHVLGDTQLPKPHIEAYDFKPIPVEELKNIQHQLDTLMPKTEKNELIEQSEEEFVDKVYKRFCVIVPSDSQRVATYFAMIPLTTEYMQVLLTRVSNTLTHADLVYTMYSDLMKRTTEQTHYGAFAHYELNGGNAMREKLLNWTPLHIIEDTLYWITNDLAQYIIRLFEGDVELAISSGDPFLNHAIHVCEFVHLYLANQERYTDHLKLQVQSQKKGE